VGAGGADWRETIPPAHITWMPRLPLIHQAPERKLVFVHAGIEPAGFPNKPEETYLSTRSDRFFNGETWPERDGLRNLTAIHGHTPALV
jgi:serine/threonine protein phosphatase 1